MPSKSFVFYEEWKDTLSSLPPQVRLEVYDAIVEYGLSGTLIELKAIAGLALSIIKKRIDNDLHRAESIRRKRSEAGKRHKGNQHTLKIGTNGTSVPTDWNKCSKTPLNKGVSEDLKNGTSVPTRNFQQLKEGALFPPNEEISPLPLKEVIPPIIPQENLTPVTRTKNFVKPSVAEIEAYCKEKGYNIDAEQFWNFYESKGWKVGNTPMKSWKSACVTWIKRNNNGANSRSNNQSGTQYHPSDEELVRQTAELMQQIERERAAGVGTIWGQDEVPF